MTRQIGTTSQHLREQIGRERKDKVRRAFLVTPYRNGQGSVLVQFTDPRKGVRGAVARAFSKTGITGPNGLVTAPSLEAGTPVTVMIRRSRVELISIDVASTSSGEGGAPSGAAGGDLGGTYPNPTVDTVHSGSSHASTQAAAEATAASALSTHAAAGDPHPSYTTAAELAAYAEPVGTVATHAAASDPHPTYTTAAELAAYAQPIDSDLTAIAAVSPSNDDILQRKAGAWVNRTVAQYLADLAAAGTTFQPLDSDLTAIAALSTTAYGRSLLEAANAAALQTLVALVIGTNVQAWDTDLDAIAALGVTNDSIIQGKSGVWAKRTIAQLLVDLAAAGTTFQPLDQDLTDIAAIAVTNDSFLQGKAGVWSKRTVAQVLADLAAAGTTFQPLDSDLTAIAAVTTTSYGRALLALANQAALIAALWDGVVTKASDESVTNNTIQNDDELFFTTVNGAMYEIELMLVHINAAGATPDLKIDLGEDSNARGVFEAVGHAAGDTAASQLLLSNQTDTATFGTGTSNRGVFIKGTHRGGGGTFRLRWAQSVTNATATKVVAGSLLRYRVI